MDSAVVRSLENILCKGVIVTIIYFLATWGLSIAWFYCFLVIYTFYTHLIEDKRTKWKLVKRLTQGEEKDILSRKLHLLPSWVHFPDVERVEWLNKIIKQSWNSVNGYMQDFIPTVVETIIGQYVKGVKITNVKMGHLPLRIDGIKVYDATSRHKIVMDVDISYAGNSQIDFYWKGLRGGVENIKFRGRIRLILQPLISTFPLVGGVQIFYMQPPEIDFDLKGVTQLLHISGLKVLIENYTLELMNSIFLFPKMLTIKFSDEVETPEVSEYEPEGILRVRLIEARNLMKKDKKIFEADSSDPYGVLQVGRMKFRTKTIEENVNPKWDFWCEFETDRNAELKVHIWDHDDASKDETLGFVKFDIGHVAVRNNSELIKRNLEGVTTGEIFLTLIWLSLSSDWNDLESILKETQLLNVPSLHTAMLLIYIDSARNVPQLSNSHLPDPYLTLSLEKDVQQTEVVKQSANPIWEQNFTFMVTNPNLAILEFALLDKKSGAKLGDITYKIEQLKNHNDMNIKFTALGFKTISEVECTILCSIKLRVFKKEEILRDASDGYVKSEATLMKQDSISSQRSLQLGSSFSSDDTGSVNSENPIVPTLDPSSVRIEATLQYNTEDQILTVLIHRATLNTIRLQRAPNTYVKLYLLQMKNTKEKPNKKRTHIERENYNPTFEASFEYPILREDLNKNQLNIVLATDRKIFERNKSNKILGQVTIHLDNSLSEPMRKWFELM